MHFGLKVSEFFDSRVLPIIYSDSVTNWRGEQVLQVARLKCLDNVKGECILLINGCLH